MFDSVSYHPAMGAASAITGDGYRAILRGDGVVDIVIRGVWNRDRVDAFFDAFAAVHDDARQRYGLVRSITTVEAVQPPLIAMHVRDHALALKRPGDRRAFVVATFLSKLQIKRLATTEEFGLFTDRPTAETWLRR